MLAPSPEVVLDVTLDLFMVGYRCINPRIPTTIKYTATK
jgi:hypothetical protein